MDRLTYETYVKILREELVPAQGCTEPCAIAFASAVARKALGGLPDRMEVQASGNLIKNVKSVSIPHGGELRGVAAAAVLGAVGGDPDRLLEVLGALTPDSLEQARAMLRTEYCRVSVLRSSEPLHLLITAFRGADEALVELAKTHTHIVRVEKNGTPLYRACLPDEAPQSADRTCLRVAEIVEFAASCSLEDIEDVLSEAVRCNMAIARQGLEGDWGVKVGKLLLGEPGQSFRAYAAAGSDARMSGCPLPVYILSGSGNQGITATVPVVVYSREKEAPREKMYRALALSMLIAIHLKTGIGRLSAYCGAVSAAVGSGCAMTYLDGGGLRQIQDTIVNTLANVSGVFCDGAKPSCAAKIASSLDAAMLGHRLAMEERAFHSGDGILGADTEKTIDSVGRIARYGMKGTDEEILRIMTE